jgi:hypothetical protein
MLRYWLWHATRRNVTIQGLPGQTPVLDLDYQQHIVRLCSTCIFTFANMTVAQER